MRTLRHPGALSGMASAAFVAATLSVPAVTHAASGSPAATPARGGVLNVLSYTDGDWLDPNITYYSVGYTLAREYSRQLYSMPARKGETTDTVPDLATRMPRISDHGKTYRITIRKGAKWDAAKPHQVTAADVVRGVKTTCNPARPFGGLPDYEDLLVGFANFCQGFARVQPTATAIKHYTNSHGFKGVQSSHSNPRTVIFHLTHRASYFTDMLALPAFSPRAKQMLNYLPGSLKDSKNVVADGPYRVSSYQPGQRLVFVRNPAWKGGTDPVRKAYVDKIVVSMGDSTTSSVAKIHKGSQSADVYLGGIDYFDAAQFQAKGDKRLTIMPSITSSPYILFNCASPNNNGGLQQTDVRQALSYGLDRSEIRNAIGFTEFNPPLTHVLPPEILGSLNFNRYPHDTDKANSMLQAAGQSNMTLTFLYEEGFTSSFNVFQAVKNELSQVGVTVTGKAVSPVDYYTKYLANPSKAQTGDWDLAEAGWGPDWYGNAALSFFGPLYDGRKQPPASSNYGLFDDPNVNDLIDEGSRATESKAFDVWHRADLAVMNDAPVFPLSDPRTPLYRATQAHNAVSMPMMGGFDLSNIWLDPDKNGG